MPCLEESSPVPHNNLMQFQDFVRPEAMISGQSDRFEPELCIPFRLLNVDMRRFSSFIAEEEKPISSNSKYCRHLSCRK
jgi:hypothetical protein